MRYRSVVPALLLERESRFLARVLRDGHEESVHVKNTGRLRELLVPGAEVYLEPSGNPTRRTAHSLVAVRQGERVVNIDSQAPNEVVHEELLREDGWLADWLWTKAANLPLLPDRSQADRAVEPRAPAPSPSHPYVVRREVRFGASRFDFALEAANGSRLLLEVKGVTLAAEGLAEFPDAPTARGARHLDELAAAAREGHSAAVLFVIQMEEIRGFAPCRRIDPAFTDALQRASAAGVHMAACDCQVTPDTLRLNRPVPVTGL
ncbi:DNA/RNA nuclease SfsA [Gorillibacterium sp. CAU 1737]|uniref:DNA/RNA nuclease SfsA n=1 Tax=Gorillibacterium sp. CAU 1737 TaxID=3140362 RepID=UPI003260AC74